MAWVPRSRRHFVVIGWLGGWLGGGVRVCETVTLTLTVARVNVKIRFSFEVARDLTRVQ